MTGTNLVESEAAARHLRVAEGRRTGGRFGPEKGFEVDIGRVAVGWARGNFIGSPC